MHMIAKQNAENYKNLTGFTDVFNYLYATEKYTVTLDRKGHLDFVPQFVLSIDSSLKVDNRRLKYVLVNDLFYSLNYL